MMRMKTKPTEPTSINGSGDNEWEVRPGGMLVQKRDPNAEHTRIPPPTIRVRVKYGSIYHEIHISSQATFGELKKMLSGPTGLHHEDQKLMYKDKERNSKTFLDVVGVKDRSKMVLLEDPISQEKRYLEMRKNAKMEKAAKSISEISLEVDRLAGQVSAFESVISKGGKVAEKTLLNLIELLMNQLLKLDGIMAEGDVKLQRKMQVKRVQKYVETLDVLKIKNSVTGSTGSGSQVPVSKPPLRAASPIPGNQEHRNSNGHGGGGFFPNSRRSVGNFSTVPVPTKQQEKVLVTTEWETFDSTPAPPSSSNGNGNGNGNTIHPKFSWDLL
ncbi:BAG family molecular chaperone regulator 2-like [Cynara cardunculus var. scolymus]|uniref:BAG domain-containing protein n=1 Tax=Cynara cardunculus var. scolymus TaxID=59895 RepID=A0A103YJ67_CYNCS|nr:BAG family molecular chaperone regulator 2-like [Cynara cardunculus var. scolymus]KVI10115.1 BAG domain-containing protein [Cynara cardunculus var. scolymus]